MNNVNKRLMKQHVFAITN